MKDYIEDRVIEIAQYIVDNNATVRSTAKVFNVSKSTVHKDVHGVLEKNKAERHIRGGMATREKYRHVHNCSNEKFAER